MLRKRLARYLFSPPGGVWTEADQDHLAIAVTALVILGAVLLVLLGLGILVVLWIL